MKTLLGFALVTLSSMLVSANEITLNPGERITLQPYSQTTVSCSGSGSSYERPYCYCKEHTYNNEYYIYFKDPTSGKEELVINPDRIFKPGYRSIADCYADIKAVSACQL